MQPDQLKKLVKYLAVSILLYLSTASEAMAAKSIYPLVTYKCDPGADIATITNSLLEGNKGATFHYSAKNGTYSPWNMVDIDHESDSTEIIRTKKITRVCSLSSGDYTITLEPQVFSRDMDATCGSSISTAFTVTIDGVDIQERTPFEDFCRGNSPIITRVTIFGKTGEVKIKRIPRYKFH